MFFDSGTGDAMASSSGSSGSSLSCESDDPGFCACSANGGASNGTSCSPSTLSEPGACCASSGYPSGGICTCASFTCDVNEGGGRDCWFHAGDTGHTTSATGAVCCLRLQGICSCYASENADSCTGFPTVSSCTSASVTPCTDAASDGDVAVPTCR